MFTELNKIIQPNRIVALLLSLALIVSADFCMAFDNEYAQKQATEISGISEVAYALSSAEFEASIDITPCYSTRKVYLQQYSTKSGKYKIVSEYITDDAYTAKLRINIPKENRKKTYGKWRIYVEECENAASAELNFEIINKNIVSKIIFLIVLYLSINNSYTCKECKKE